MGSQLERDLLELDKRDDLSPDAKAALTELKRRGIIRGGFFEETGKVAGAVGAGFNRGVTGVAGLPADIVMGVADAVVSRSSPGAKIPDVILRNAPTSENLRRSLNALRQSTEVNQADPRTRFAGRIGEEVGANTVPLAALLQAGKAGVKGGAVLGPILSQTRAAPGATTAVDTALATTGGIGAATANEVAPGSANAELAGALIGTLAPAGAFGVAKGSLAGGRGFSRAEQERRAAAALRELSSDPAALERNLQQPGPDIVSPTTGQVANDTGLLQAQRAIDRDTGVTAARGREAANNEAVRSALEDTASAPGDVAGTQAFFKERLDRAGASIDESIAKAQETARRKIDEIGPDISRDEAATINRQEIETAHDQGRATERGLYTQAGVDDIDTAPTKDALREVIDSEPKANRSLIPPVVFRVAGTQNVDDIPTGLVDEFGNKITREEIAETSLLDDVESLDEVTAVRTLLLEARRAERSPNRKRILDKAIEAINDGINPNTVGDGVDLDKLAEARAFSKAFNDKFTRGPIGKLRQIDVQGGQRTPDELTLEKLTPSGQSGGVAVRALLQATDSAAAQDSVVQFLRDKFLRVGAKDGNINPRDARKFLSENAEILENFPQLEQRFSDAILAAERAELKTKTGLARKKALESSEAAKFVGPRGAELSPEIAVRRALSGNNPSAGMAKLKTSAVKDKSGKALNGLKNGFFEHMMDKIAIQGIDENRARIVMAGRLRKFVKANRGPIKVLYGTDGRKMFDKIVKELETVERTAVVRGGSDTFQNAASQSFFVETLLAVAGARVGRIFGTIQSAGIGAQLGRKIAGKLTPGLDETVAILQEALTNPKFARLLLLKRTEKNIPAVDRVIAKVLQATGKDELRRAIPSRLLSQGAQDEN